LALVNLGIGRAVARYLQRDTVGGGIEMKRNLHLASPDEIRQDIDNLLLNGALLTIEDTGCGMPREHLASLFEGLFTTKSEKEPALACGW